MKKFVIKLKNLNCVNSKTQIVTKTQMYKLWQLKNSDYDKTKKNGILTTQLFAKLNLTCNQTQKLSFDNLTNLILTKLKNKQTKLNNSNCDKTQKPKLWQNSNLNWDKT